MDMEKRARMAAESILENESFRSGLDDSGASAILDWGTTRAVSITRDTGSFEDDEEAREAVYPRMRALRQMIDAAKDLCRPEITMKEGISLLTQLVEKAALVYGENATIPKRIYWNMFTSVRVEDAGQNIRALRAMLEKNIQNQE